jgi:hypothetical protein
MILVLSRGGNYPKDLHQAKSLVQLYREIQVGFGTLARQSRAPIVSTNGIKPNGGRGVRVCSNER